VGHSPSQIFLRCYLPLFSAAFTRWPGPCSHHGNRFGQWPRAMCPPWPSGPALTCFPYLCRRPRPLLALLFFGVPMGTMNFNRIAGAYRWLEYGLFGNALQRRRCEFLSDVTDARHVLILGDGDGRFTAEFLKRNTTATVTLVDSSSHMLRLARERVAEYRPGLEHVYLLLADARTVALSGPYDLVISHFFLDCLTYTETKALIERVSAATTPDARWLLSEFNLPGFGFRRLLAATLIKALYLGCRLITGLTTTALADYPLAMRAGSFGRDNRKCAAGGLLVSEMWRKAGISRVTPRRPSW
jgi:SAM-dependent methyltransferase